MVCPGPHSMGEDAVIYPSGTKSGGRVLVCAHASQTCEERRGIFFLNDLSFFCTPQFFCLLGGTPCLEPGVAVLGDYGSGLVQGLMTSPPPPPSFPFLFFLFERKEEGKDTANREQVRRKKTQEKHGEMKIWMYTDPALGAGDLGSWCLL